MESFCEPPVHTNTFCTLTAAGPSIYVAPLHIENASKVVLYDVCSTHYALVGVIHCCRSVMLNCAHPKQYGHEVCGDTALVLNRSRDRLAQKSSEA